MPSWCGAWAETNAHSALLPLPQIRHSEKPMGHRLDLSFVEQQLFHSQYSEHADEVAN